MNQSFENLWLTLYPNKLPIPHLFKHYFSESWIRLFNFKNGQRYANNAKEMDELLAFQNELFNECIPSEPIYLVTYQFKHPTEIMFEQNFSHLPYTFIESSTIYPYKIDSNFYDEDHKDLEFYSLSTETIWQTNLHNAFLSNIANDEINGFLIPVTNNKVIIAPYDGGVDLLLFDQDLQNYIKTKYYDRISLREDGF